MLAVLLARHPRPCRSPTRPRCSSARLPLICRSSVRRLCLRMSRARLSVARHQCTTKEIPGPKRVRTMKMTETSILTPDTLVMTIILLLMMMTTTTLLLTTQLTRRVQESLAMLQPVATSEESRRHARCDRTLAAPPPDPVLASAAHWQALQGHGQSCCLSAPRWHGILLCSEESQIR